MGSAVVEFAAHGMMSLVKVVDIMLVWDRFILPSP